MFNSSSRSRDNGAAASAAGQGKRGMFSVIGHDVVISGNVRAGADLHIDGSVEGDVDCGSLIQGAESRIIGNIRAETARITGHVAGRVAVRQLTVDRTARITGDVEYENIAIENGATIDGHLRHNAAGTLKLDGPPPPAALPEPLLIVSGEG